LYFGVRAFTAGTGTLPLGVYGIGRASSEDPFVLYMPYLPVENLGQDVCACDMTNPLQPLIATTGNGATDKRILTINPATRAYEIDFLLETSRITQVRDRQQQLHVEIAYGDLSTNWTPSLSAHFTTSSDGSSSLSIPLVNDTQRKILEGDVLLPDVCEWYLRMQCAGTGTGTGFSIDGIYITIF